MSDVENSDDDEIMTESESGDFSASEDEWVPEKDKKNKQESSEEFESDDETPNPSPAKRR